MRQYRKRHAEEIAHAADQLKGTLEEARAAVDRGERERAGSLWQKMLAECPAIVAASSEAARLPIDLGELDAADTLIQAALQEFPKRTFLWEAAAVLVSRRGDHAEAMRRYDAMRRRAPNSPSAYIGLADSAMALGRDKEAEAVLAKGMRGTGRSIHIQARRARLAEERQDWAVAEQRWRVMWKEFEHPPAAIAAAECCIRRADHDAADLILSQAVEAAPGSPDVWRAYARAAGLRGDAAEQARRWEAARKLHPALVPGN